MKPIHIARGGPAQIYINLYICMCLDSHIQTKINNDDDSMVPTSEWHEQNRRIPHWERKEKGLAVESLSCFFFFDFMKQWEILMKFHLNIYIEPTTTSGHFLLRRRAFSMNDFHLNDQFGSFIYDHRLIHLNVEYRLSFFRSFPVTQS